MGVIYKILKQQRHLSMELNTATKCKVQAAIKQRQLHRLEQRTQQEHDESLAEQQLQQLCRFLAENAARKKRQRLKLQQDPSNHESATHSLAGTHDMDLLMEQLSTYSDATPSPSPTPSPASTSNRAVTSAAPRVSILLKIRHQIFERKRQRQRQLAELVKQRMVVWRPW
ncbi:uncharacterized protein LOC111593016 [Drosophila hydei]|uniref:Uncharacterized protein LOC111593016 n=1 Tax=Drosophila hydei TaxID=7224 RepID=A0A6J1L699_DROHY|nr:uncharacterized protein LOC111593016 [Drosophila hydei]